MSTITTATAHGVRVVTQIIPLEGKAEMSGTEHRVRAAKSNLSDMTQMFLRGEPTALGIIQIFIGIMIATLGIISFLTPLLLGQILLGGGVAFAMSGVVAVVAHPGARVNTIRGTLAVSVLSGLLAVAVVLYSCVELSARPGAGGCVDPGSRHQRNYWDCMGMVRRYNYIVDGVRGLVLVLSVLQVCLSVTLTVFSGKALRRNPALDLVTEVQTDGGGDMSTCSSEAGLLTDVQA